jgi:hypothetical protein
MNKIVIIGLAALTLAGCDARTVHINIDPSKATYSRDNRTGLCFAAFGRAKGGSWSDVADSLTVTNVPCSAEVMALVPNGQRGPGSLR